MTAHIVGGVTVALSDGPVRTDYRYGWDGRPVASLILGDGAGTVGITVTDSSPETMRELVAAVHELAAWVERHRMREVA